MLRAATKVECDDGMVGLCGGRKSGSDGSRIIPLFLFVVIYHYYYYIVF